MIYLDNAATTLQKPPCVGQAMLDALEHAGNPGRGAHEPTLHAARIVYHARETLATLLHAESPDCIAFTANVTQALNTALCGLVRPGDHVITTVCEHNSVLRPLYRLREQGAQVIFVEGDNAGRLRYDQFERLLRPNTRFVAVTHASNVTGNLTDLAFVSAFAKKHGLTLIVDAAQTAGARPIDVQALGADVLCFTGHKALLGAQGTGGLYVRPGLAVRPLVVGGSGIYSFDEAHPSQMPTALEAGTLNVPGLAGLGAGVKWLLSQGVEALHKKELALTYLFYERIVHAPGVKVYGSFAEADRAPIVSLNFGEEDAARALAGQKTYDTWQQGFLQILEALRKDKAFFTSVYRSISREQLENYLYRLTYDLMMGVVEERAAGMTVRPEDKEFIANFYKFAFVGLTLDWIKNDMRQDPAQLVEQLSTLIHGDVTKALEKCRIDKS